MTGVIASVPPLLTDVAAIVGAFTVIIGGAVASLKFPPVKWLIKTLIVKPFGEWFRGEVSEATAPIEHIVKYHLGTNDTTMPWHERLSRLEVKVGLAPVPQADEEDD